MRCLKTLVFTSVLLSSSLAHGTEYTGSFVGNAAGLTNYPTATVGTVGILQPDGTTITIGASGIITAHAGGSAGIGLIGGFGSNTALYFPYATNLVSTNTLLNGNTTNAAGGILITNLGSGNGFQIGPTGILSNGVPFGGGSPFTNTSGQVLNPYTNQAPVAFSNVIFINAAGNIVGGITNGVIYATNLFTYLVGSASVTQISNAVSLLVESSLNPFFTNSATITNANTGQATVITGSGITASNILSQTLVTTNGGNSPNGDFTNLNQQTIGGTGTEATNFALAVSNAPQHVSTNVSLNEVNVESFGAVHNGKIVNFAQIATGATTLTSTNGQWVVGDIGKVIFLPFCGMSHTNGFTTTIAAFVSGTNITITSSPTTGNTNIFVVYGTDDTSAITNANNYVCTNSQSSSNYYYTGGTLLFPAGIYIVNGALADPGVGTAHHNAQIYMPGFWSNNIIPPLITWQGVAGGASTSQVFGPSNTCYASGTTLWSVLPDGGGGRFLDCQNFTNNQWGSSFLGEGNIHINNFKFRILDMNFVAPPNPNLIMLDLEGAGSADVYRSSIYCGQDWYHEIYPSNTNSVGLAWPCQNDNPNNNGDEINIWGINNGMMVGEQLHVGQATILSCQNAVCGPYNNAGHSIQFDHLASYSCPVVFQATGIYWDLYANVDTENYSGNPMPWTHPGLLLADTNCVITGTINIMDAPDPQTIFSTAANSGPYVAVNYHQNPSAGLAFNLHETTESFTNIFNGGKISSATINASNLTSGSVVFAGANGQLLPVTVSTGLTYTPGSPGTLSAISGAVSSVSALDGSVTITPTTGAVTVTATPLGTAVTNWVSTSVTTGSLTTHTNLAYTNGVNLYSGSGVPSFTATNGSLYFSITGIIYQYTNNSWQPFTSGTGGSGGTWNGTIATGITNSGSQGITNGGPFTNNGNVYLAAGSEITTYPSPGGNLQIGDGNGGGLTIAMGVTLTSGNNITFSGAGNAPINAGSATGISTFGGAVDLVASAYSSTTNVLTPTATAYSQALSTLASGYTNTTATNNAYYSYNGTSGSAIWYWTAGSGTRSPIQTNTIVASGGGFPLQPNCGVQITSGIGVNAAVVFKP